LTGTRWLSERVKLNSQQLSTHLSSGVRHLYLISGDEPLLVTETLDAIRRAARDDGYTDRAAYVAERSFDWDEFEAGLKNYSLFASRRLVEVRLPTGKPGDKGARKIIALAGEEQVDTLLIFITPKLDRTSSRSKWATTLAKAAVCIDHPAPDHRNLTGWISARLKQAGLQCDRDALELLASRVEGNLLAAKQEIDKLQLMSGGERITLDSMRSSVTDGARYDVFQLADAALSGDARRAARILQGLEREGVAAPLVLWSLAREIGLLANVVYALERGLPMGKAMVESGVWRLRQDLIGKAARPMNVRAAESLVAQACRAERTVKGAAAGKPWNALMDLTLALAVSSGAPRLAAGVG
jgi:DNA polymerase-3 subunit delta